MEASTGLGLPLTSSLAPPSTFTHVSTLEFGTEDMPYSKICDLALHTQGIAEELEDAARRVIRSGWFALGPEVEAFEKSFANWCGVPYCRGLANGTDALELGLRALGVTKDSEVILAANAGMYSTTAILAIGATPVYADINLLDYCIDPAGVEKLITPKTTAIIATHLYGHLCDMPSLCEIAGNREISVLEDCAQAHGAELHGRRAGSWGGVAAFSFYPTKNLGALGDGGALVTQSQEIMNAATQLRQYGWETKYRVVRPGGCNSRLDEIQAAFLSVKLKHLNLWTQKRQALGKLYSENIRHPEVQVSQYVSERHVYHLYVVRSSRRDSLKQHLKRQGIASDVHYPLLDYQQPIFNGTHLASTHLPESEQAAKEVLTLPCYPELSLRDAQFVANAINQWEA